METKQYSYSLLYIEDQYEIRKKYLQYFEQKYKKVYEANNGKKALEIYKQCKPEIIICDINLPDISGLDILEAIRKHDHQTKIIMLTAYSDNRKLLKAVSLKLTAYLVKPVNRNDLKLALAQAHSEYEDYKITSKKRLLFKENFLWNYQSNSLYKETNEVILTPNERKLFQLLCKNINITQTNENIINYIWNENYEEEKYNSIKILIKNLRKKLPINTIKNVYGEGYRIIVS